MTETTVYISVSDDQERKHLTIDGNLDLLGCLLKTIRNGEAAKRGISPTGDPADQGAGPAGGEHEHES